MPIKKMYDKLLVMKNLLAIGQWMKSRGKSQKT
jgi:hypothetical protein